MHNKYTGKQIQLERIHLPFQLCSALYGFESHYHEALSVHAINELRMRKHWLHLSLSFSYVLSLDSQLKLLSNYGTTLRPLLFSVGLLLIFYFDCFGNGRTRLLWKLELPLTTVQFWMKNKRNLLQFFVRGRCISFVFVLTPYQKET